MYNRINREISYNWAAETSDPEVMFNYAIDGVIDNDHINGWNRIDNQAGWQDGAHIAEVYLDHCVNPIPPEVISELDRWLELTSSGRDYF